MKGPEDARRQVAYWADEGATSFKAYMQIRRDELGAAIDEVHKRGMKITGPPLLGDVWGSRGSRHRQPRARIPGSDGFRDRQATRCVPWTGAGSADDRGARRERRAIQGAREEIDREAGDADVDPYRVRNFHAWPSGAAGRQRTPAVTQGAVSPDAHARCRQSAVGLRQALSQGACARTSVREGGRNAHRRDGIRLPAEASSQAMRINGSSN